jgi:hypothetical protein
MRVSNRVVLTGCLVASLCVFGCRALRGEKDPWGAGAVLSSTEEMPACDTCHVDVAQRHAASVHGGVGLACRQCHRGAQHETFEAVTDGTCGGCHLPEYQQTRRSAHFETAVALSPEDMRASRAGGFRVGNDGGWHFVAGAGGGPEASRLCVGCHQADHSFDLRTVRRADGCTFCHADRGDHYVFGVTSDNRCLGCHVKKGTTVIGQTVTSHAFVMGDQR